MGDEVFIVSIIFSAVVAIVFMGIASDIIKAWVKSRNSKSIAENEEFLEALRKFKEKTDRRLSNLEMIASDHEQTVDTPIRSSNDLSDRPDDQETDTAGKSLKNMLKG